MAFGTTRLHSADLLRRLVLVAFTVGALLISLLAMHSMAGGHASAGNSPAHVAASGASPHAAPNLAADPSATVLTETLTFVSATISGGVLPVCDTSTALGCTVTVAVCALLLMLGSLLALMTLPRRSHPLPARSGRFGRDLRKLRFLLPPPSLTVLCVSRI